MQQNPGPNVADADKAAACCGESNVGNAQVYALDSPNMSVSYFWRY
ncbi:hypothetical protein [Rhodobacter sp. TJ_12]|nr:hypothetical protein [Rhodobacter sp. TJ_12]